MTVEARRPSSIAAPTINLASVVHGLEDYLRAHGRDPAAALRRAGLAPRDITDPERRVPLLRYLELLEICAELLDDPLFGLEYGAAYDPRHAGVVGNVALTSRTVGDALRTISRYLPVMVDSAVFDIEVTNGTAFAYSYYYDPLLCSYRQKSDWAIAFSCSMIRNGLGDPDWQPAEVLLPYLADETAADRRRRAALIGGAVRTGHPWAGIRFDAAILERPMRTADASLERLMRHYGDLRLSALPASTGQLEQLRQEIARLLVCGESSIEQLARATGLSGRTLQRRLRELGVNYSELRDEVRRTLALNLLQNDSLALGEIAFALGYSEVSAFNHAFKRWLGQSPGDYRASRPAGGAGESA